MNVLDLFSGIGGFSLGLSVMTETKHAELPPVEFPHREREHEWNQTPARTIPASQSHDRRTRILKKCPHCGMTKITVQPKDGMTVTDEFKISLRRIYTRYDGLMLPPRDGDRRSKLGRQEYATDLNGYRATK